MAYAVPPGEDDDLLNVLKLPHGQLPPWVNQDDIYRDLPQVVAGDSFQSTDGAGRQAYYVLTPLRAMGSRTRRTVGGGFWKVEKTITLLPTADEATSSKPAPEGSCTKLSFILRPPGGPEGRTGWLMKQYLLPHALGTPAGPALCKLYFKKSAAAASTSSTAAPTTAAAAAKAAALLVAAAAARPLRLPTFTPGPKVFLKKPAAAKAAAAPSLPAASRGPRPLRVPASTTCASRLRLPASTPCSKVFLKKPAAEAPSTAAPAAAKAAVAPSLPAASRGARPLRVPASTLCASRLRLPASTPCTKLFLKKPAAEAPPAAAPAKAAAAPSLPETSRGARPLRVPASTPCASRPPLLSTTAQDSGPPLCRQLSSISSPPPPAYSSTSGRRWVLVETEAATPPPQPHHDRVLKRIYQLLEVDEVEVEEGEVVEQGEYFKKRAKFCCDISSYMMLKDTDFQKLDAGSVGH